MIWIITYIVSNLIFIGIMYYMGINAPHGYQDEKGFHYTKK
jgi:hypothetical protein